jgi:hypothetical protein
MTGLKIADFDKICNRIKRVLCELSTADLKALIARMDELGWSVCKRKQFALEIALEKLNMRRFYH